MLTFLCFAGVFILGLSLNLNLFQRALGGAIQPVGEKVLRDGVMTHRLFFPCNVVSVPVPLVRYQ